MPANVPCQPRLELAEASALPARPFCSTFTLSFLGITVVWGSARAFCDASLNSSLQLNGYWVVNLQLFAAVVNYLSCHCIEGLTRAPAS